MIDVVKYIVDALVDNKDAVSITESGDTIKISVDKKDMGKIIGRQGRIAKAIRTVVKAAGQKSGVKYSVDILEAGEAAAETESDTADESGDDEE